MSEYIGSRISLISNSDIRYVGTLVEINSENATVALENVMSYGTEDRRTGEEAYGPSTSLYDYILFRGSDVKDLRIEEAPKESSPAPPPQMPNDPAILGSARPTQAPQNPAPPQPTHQEAPGFPQHPPHFNQFPPYNAHGMPPHFGRGYPAGFQAPPFQGYPPGMPFGPQGPGGPPPHFYGGQQFAPGPFPPPAGDLPPGPAQQMNEPGAPKVSPKESKPVEIDTDTKPPPPARAPAAAEAAKAQAPPLPIESKPDVSTALAPPAQAKPAPKPAPPTGPKGRVVPAVPRPAQHKAPAGAPTGPASTSAAPTGPSKPAATPASQQSAAEAAAAAVAAAMAKLPVAAKPAPGQQPSKDITDNLTRKINEMRVDEQARRGNFAPQGPASRAASRVGRGRGRGGRDGGRVAIPTTDFDFESANKKFNKEELAKEAQAGDTANGSSPTVADSAVNGGSAAPDEDVVIPPQQPGAYDKKKSFFDDISSELKDREAKKTFGGPEFRNEERRRNIETFGQGSVDGYRGGGGFRGRGRGGGRGGRGGGFRGPRGGIGSMAGAAGTRTRGGPPAAADV